MYCTAYYLLNIVYWSQTLFLSQEEVELSFCPVSQNTARATTDLFWRLGGGGVCNNTPRCVILVSLTFMYLNQSICLFDRQYEITSIFLNLSPPSPPSTKYSYGAIFFICFINMLVEEVNLMIILEMHTGYSRTYISVLERPYWIIISFFFTIRDNIGASSY